MIFNIAVYLDAIQFWHTCSGMVYIWELVVHGNREVWIMTIEPKKHRRSLNFVTELMKIRYLKQMVRTTHYGRGRSDCADDP